MDQKQLEDFIANAALLAAHLSQQCDKASSELQHAATTFREDVAESQAELASNARAAVRESLAAEVPLAVRAIDETTQRFQTMAERLQLQQQTLDRRSRFLGWQSLGAVATAVMVALAATGYFAWSNVKRAQRAQVQAEVLEALRHVSITSCDGRPCVKLEDGLPRWPRNDEYVLVDGGSAANATVE